MSPIEKAVMDAYIAAGTREEPGHECVRAAMEAWLALSPGAGPAEAAREVYAVLDRLRLVGRGGGVEAVEAEARHRVVGAYRRAEAIGLHPDNCLDRAVAAWLRERPADDRATARRRVETLLQAAPTEV